MKFKDLFLLQGLLFFCLVAWNSLIALPSGGEVIHGYATLLPSSKDFQINANGKAILHWDSFNIAPGEAVRFVQSQMSQAILNRVTSGSASEILGNLQANCPIYLINPNGVLIGSSACIDTAGFLASTANLSNEVFWQGSEMLFQEFGNGSIVNLGKINVSQGDVFLIARAGIDNQGTIEVPNGIAMLTTCEMMLYPDTKKCIFIRVNDAAEEGIQNSGTIQALAVELNTASPYEKAIQHTGSIEAFATLEQNGHIYLVAEESTAMVNGSLLAESGEIRVLGQTVSLEDGAIIDASGEKGGGTILIGGDYQGNNSEIKNAEKVFVHRNTEVKADALQEGNGGKIIFWGDESMAYEGHASAKGGSKGGDGGFIE
ncbi:MAG: filamentous hemagglutinin N-terminal domain-containing protein, partial [Chlamydiales bacterium]|nr:filamentous hemagglutinin N-terminal domain-containing protein [Chlamydiales bacterium]